MKMLTSLLLLAFFLSWFQSITYGCTLTMGYRTSERPPMIAAKPDNSGLYWELYQAAAERIQCHLKVLRQPKKRILFLLKTGQVDFYPGLNFTKKRAHFIYYLDNGLPGMDVGISRKDLAEITHLQQLRGKVLLLSLGGPNFLKGIRGVLQKTPRELSLDHAIDLIREGQADFYIYNLSSVEYALKQRNILDVKLHRQCCGGSKPLYLGFSQASKYFKEVPNRTYYSAKPMSVENFPTQIEPGTVAHRFGQALAEMAQEGHTQTLYKRYHQ